MIGHILLTIAIWSVWLGLGFWPQRPYSQRRELYPLGIGSTILAIGTTFAVWA